MVTIALLVIFIILFSEGMTTGAVIGLAFGILAAASFIAYQIRLQNKNLSSQEPK